MTRKECLKILKDKGHQEYKELHHIYWTNYNKAKAFFKPIIDDMKKERPGIDIQLHHIEFNDQNYEKWDTVVPLYNDEHCQIHSHNRRPTEETRKKMSASGKMKVFTDEHMNNIKKNHWSKKDNAEIILNKIAEKNKGRPSSLRGKPRSEETKQKIKDKRKSQVFSEESRKKMSESAKLRYQRLKEKKAA